MPSSEFDCDHTDGGQRLLDGTTCCLTLELSTRLFGISNENAWAADLAIRGRDIVQVWRCMIAPRTCGLRSVSNPEVSIRLRGSQGYPLTIDACFRGAASDLPTLTPCLVPRQRLHLPRFRNLGEPPRTNSGAARAIEIEPSPRVGASRPNALGEPRASVDISPGPARHGTTGGRQTGFDPSCSRSRGRSRIRSRHGRTQ